MSFPAALHSRTAASPSDTWLASFCPAVCVLIVLAAASADVGIAREVVDASCLYPCSFETRPFTAEVSGFFGVLYMRTSGPSISALCLR